MSMHTALSEKMQSKMYCIQLDRSQLDILFDMYDQFQAGIMLLPHAARALQVPLNQDITKLGKDASLIIQDIKVQATAHNQMVLDLERLTMHRKTLTEAIKLALQAATSQGKYTLAEDILDFQKSLRHDKTRSQNPIAEEPEQLHQAQRNDIQEQPHDREG